MADRDEPSYGGGYGTEYLSAYDKILENQRLASQPGRSDITAMTNPLVAERDTGLVPATAEVAPVSATPNPLTRAPLVAPPVPLSSMPVEQQMAWQDRAIKETSAQRVLQKQVLDMQIARRQEEQGMEAFKQGQALIARSGELDPGDIKNYPILRAKLAREHPLGAAAPEVQAAFATLDKAYENTLRTETDVTKAEEQSRRLEERTRLSDARKTAADLGPEALARFSEREKRSPDEAITGVMQEAAKIKQANINQQLLNAGMTQEEVNQKFQRPEGFLYEAGIAETKQRETPAQEARRLQGYISVVGKMRPQHYDPADPTPEWTQEQEADLQNVIKQYNTLQDRGRGGDRLGVQGAFEGQSFYKGYATTPRQQPPGPAPQQEPARQQQPVTAQATPAAVPMRRGYYTPAPVQQAAGPQRAYYTTKFLSERERAAEAAARLAPEFVPAPVQPMRGYYTPAPPGQPPRVAGPAAQPSPTSQPVVQERRKIHPETGQTIVLRNGKWVDSVTGKEI